MQKKKLLGYSFLAVVYYLILFTNMDLFKNPSISGGPCGPGPVFIFFFLSPFLILPVLSTSFILYLKGRRHHLGPLLVHFLAIVFVLVIAKV
jgi:hypothetical protein